MKVTVSEVRGIKSLAAFNVYHTLLLGLKMLPAYLKEDYDEFLGRIELMPVEDKRKMIREAVKFVPLAKEEVESLLHFCKDGNGIAFTASNIGNLNPIEISECIELVCMEIMAINVTMVTDDEKKNSKTSALT